MTTDKDKDKEIARGGAARTAAEWYVELDARGADPARSSALATWLKEDDTRESDLERCEAAVQLTQELARDEDVQWAFDEAARLAADPPHHASIRRVAWHQRPAFAWSVAGLAVIVAAVAVAWRASPPAAPATTPMAAGDALPAEVVIRLAAADPVAVLPGEVVVDARSVAVLPFTGAGGELQDAPVDAATNAIAAQLYDEVVRQLATIPGVYVVGRPSIVPYENRDLRPEVVAAQLGVRGIVEARVATDNGRVRVLLQVIDVAGEGVLSEDAFDRPVEELTAMRTDIVTNIAVALANPTGSVAPVASY